MAAAGHHPNEQWLSLNQIDGLMIAITMSFSLPLQPYTLILAFSHFSQSLCHVIPVCKEKHSPSVIIEKKERGFLNDFYY